MTPSSDGSVSVVNPPTPDPRDQTTPDSTYRPHLDGLRAVAVYLVVLFHAGLAQFSGGYVGVDVFFVLSGFLVTQVLLRDLSGTGSIRFGRFYSRRFRRLLPAAFVALIITALVFAAVTPAKALAAIGAFKAAFLYSANWYFIRESTDYFGAEVAGNPVLQFWSLAVEEQFYIVWPIALAGTFWLARRVMPSNEARFARAVVALAGTASVLWALYLRTSAPDRAYFGTDTRAYQLLAGALIALTPGIMRELRLFRRTARVAAPVAMLTLLFLASSLTDADAIVRGVATVLATCIALVALERSDGGVVKGVLSSSPFVYLGRISYGTYLWHWPVIILAAELLELSPRSMAWFACLVATGLASLSYQLVEQPIRASRLLDLHPLVVIGTGLAITVVSALVLVPRIIDSGSTASAVPVATDSAFTPVPSSIDTAQIYLEGFGTRLDAGAPEPRTCVGADPSRCTVVRGSGPHVLLMGDSNAMMMIPALTRIADDNDLTLSLETIPGCPWPRGIYVNSQEIRAECRAAKEDAYDRVIPALDPDVILVTNRDPADSSPGGSARTPLDPALRDAIPRSLTELATGDRKVVVLEPNPTGPAGTDPLGCLETAESLEECRYVADTDATAYELFTRDLADSNDQVWSADFDRLTCPFLPICDPVVDGIVVKWDRQHLTTRFSESLSGEITGYLRDNDLIP